MHLTTLASATTLIDRANAMPVFVSARDDGHSEAFRVDTALSSDVNSSRPPTETVSFVAVSRRVYRTMACIHSNPIAQPQSQTQYMRMPPPNPADYGSVPPPRASTYDSVDAQPRAVEQHYADLSDAVLVVPEHYADVDVDQLNRL
jgi:hypothetical protein